jgi:peptidoglycan/LPS O-acetylase OafA/YrhL
MSTPSNETSTIKKSGSSLEHIDYLDGWRGLAISLVLISHFALPLESPAHFIGRLGVDIFFVLSGLLMSKILFIKRTPLSTFYKRRFSRIIPVFFTYVTSIYLLGYYLQEPEAKNYLYSLSFLRTYLPETEHIWYTGIPVGHLWSLNIEEHAYLFLSLLTLIVFIRKKEFAILIGLGSLSILIHIYYKLLGDAAPITSDIRTEAAISHIFISAGYHLIHQKFDPYVRPWMIVAAMVLAIIFAKVKGGWILTPFLLAFIVNHLHLSPQKIIDFLRLKALRWLGWLSFSIYLWQQPFYLYFVKKDETFELTSFLFLGAAILAGLLSFNLIEKPARKWLNTHW